MAKKEIKKAKKKEVKAKEYSSILEGLKVFIKASDIHEAAKKFVAKKSGK